ncbi:MAG: VOC family protein [Gammaproteobacteria bacterium]|nr:VOC family protein [Gammaproteobacteria bacterium]
MSGGVTASPRLGHVVLYVHHLDAALAFYRDAIGLSETARLFGGRAVMLSGGTTHHELMLIEVGDAPGPLHGKRRGLYHIAWRVGESRDVLRDAYRRLLDAGCEIRGLADHTISQSIYLSDPDGNEVEVYVDDPQVDWRHDDSWQQAPVKPLRLD